MEEPRHEGAQLQQRLQLELLCLSQKRKACGGASEGNTQKAISISTVGTEAPCLRLVLSMIGKGGREAGWALR